MWRFHKEGDVRHVWPDDEDHDTEDDQACWCAPKVTVEDTGVIMAVHNSKDGREYIERLKEKENICKN